ncbi:IucA/IucC family siderophore biosynthesis protein, partial [Streptomyces sp. NPDC006386]
MPPPADDDSAHGDDTATGLAGRADAYAAVPLLNCLLREVARPVRQEGDHRVYRLPGGGRLLRVRGTRRPAEPEVRVAG